MEATNLRIEVAGFLVNDYQVTDRRLEFRLLDSNGRPFPDPAQHMETAARE